MYLNRLCSAALMGGLMRSLLYAVERAALLYLGEGVWAYPIRTSLIYINKYINWSAQR